MCSESTGRQALCQRRERRGEEPPGRVRWGEGGGTEVGTGPPYHVAAGRSPVKPRAGCQEAGRLGTVTSAPASPSTTAAAQLRAGRENGESRPSPKPVSRHQFPGIPSRRARRPRAPEPEGVPALLCHPRLSLPPPPQHTHTRCVSSEPRSDHARWAPPPRALLCWGDANTRGGERSARRGHPRSRGPVAREAGTRLGALGDGPSVLED